MALSKQTHIGGFLSCNFHSGYCMSAAVKASPERVAICTYRRPLLTAKVKVRNQPKMHPLIILAFIHLLRQIRKLLCIFNQPGIIFHTGASGKPTCSRTVPHIRLRSRTHRHGDPHQCRQCQQGQPHLYTPCFCIFHNIPPSYFYMESQSYFHTARIIYYTEKSIVTSIFSIRFVSYFLQNFNRAGWLIVNTKKEPPDLSGHPSLPSLKNISSFPRHLINVFISSSSRSRMMVWIIFLWKSL